MTDEGDMKARGPDGILAQECRGDFWDKLEGAIDKAGGRRTLLDELAGMPLKDVVNMLAQNGIRMVYDDAWHINALLLETAQE